MGTLRRPRLGPLLGLDPTPGLSELLSDELSSDELPDEVLHHEHQLPLEVLTSGWTPPNPSELLESDRFAAVLDMLARRAEIVILDSPALVPVSDAAVMARLTAAVLMVARVSSTRAEHLDIAAESLRAVGKNPVGTVLNGLPARSGQAYVYGPSHAVERPASVVPVWDQ